jgi:hypothetical protein
VSCTSGLGSSSSPYGPTVVASPSPRNRLIPSTSSGLALHCIQERRRCCPKSIGAPNTTRNGSHAVAPMGASVAIRSLAASPPSGATSPTGSCVREVLQVTRPFGKLRASAQGRRFGTAMDRVGGFTRHVLSGVEGIAVQFFDRAQETILILMKGGGDSLFARLRSVPPFRPAGDWSPQQGPSCRTACWERKKSPAGSHVEPQQRRKTVMTPTIVSKRVYLIERCRCKQRTYCFHHRPLSVLHQFQNGRLLVSNGDHVRAVDPKEVRTTPT